ncbi:MAG: transporter substrate-binding domain-containing protein [Gammaproteobacteria bacterium]|nr:transporter substrate-binding domain-containing protein [Gammaproteobacteria bacterium]
MLMSWANKEIPCKTLFFKIALIAQVIFSTPLAFAVDNPVIVLNDTNEAPLTTATHSGYLDMIATEAFRRIGYTLKLEKLPAERALINANDGLADGDLTRIAGLESLYPNLIRVPEKLTQWEFTAFSKDSSVPSTWEAVRSHSVGHIRGWKIYEKNLAGAARVTTTEDSVQLFRMLELNRIEVALYERWLGLALLKQQGVRNVHPISPPLAVREMFIYLNKRHTLLAPKLAQALRTLKREGFYDRAFREKLLPYREPTGQ